MQITLLIYAGLSLLRVIPIAPVDVWKEAQIVPIDKASKLYSSSSGLKFLTTVTVDQDSSLKIYNSTCGVKF